MAEGGTKEGGVMAYAPVFMGVIDPDVKHVGVSKMRSLTAAKLRELDDTVYVFQDGEEPLAIMFSYDRWQRIMAEMYDVDITSEAI